jgi:hypothetical protein
MKGRASEACNGTPVLRSASGNAFACNGNEGILRDFMNNPG